MFLLLPGEMKPQCPFFSGVAAVSLLHTFSRQPNFFLKAGLGRELGCPFPTSRTLLPFPVCLLLAMFSILPSGLAPCPFSSTDRSLREAGGWGGDQGRGLAALNAQLGPFCVSLSGRSDFLTNRLHYKETKDFFLLE